MFPKTDEKSLQKETIKLFKTLGYNYIPPKEIKKYREGNEVLLKLILKQQLIKLNSFEYKGDRYKFSDKNIQKAIDELDVSLHEGLIEANSKITDMLLYGNSYKEVLKDGSFKSFSLRYIDFKEPKNNIFHITEEFSVNRVAKDKTRIPDIVLFINGVVFGVIELKKSSVSIEEGISQMIRNQTKEEIPHLFKYAQMLLVSNRHSVKYATVGTPSKFWAIWREESKSPFPIFTPKRVLDFIQSFILFDNRVKKIARYQQYFAIKKTLELINQFDSKGVRGGGLIWHTQGSGKSLTMVMLTKIIKREIVGSKIIVVTDRKDLDSQIVNTFNNSEVEAKRAGSGRELIKLLKSGVSVVTTLIHKFEMVKSQNISFHDPNIFILVDESHRTQSGELHRAMRKVFKKGCYIGFTGTPLLKREKSSFIKFGGEIDRYTIDQAVKDRAVLPLLYEGRMVEQWINDKNGLNRRFEIISKNLNEAQKLDLKRKWARFKFVASSERRLEVIALDINEHFKNHLKNTGFKAILATNSKYEAIKYHKLFEEFGDIKSSFVISAVDTREGYSSLDEQNQKFIVKEWQRILREYGDEERIKDEFKNGDLELLIVVDKLLTGFDAPKTQILYIDKSLKDHTLLQAIARVNRLHDGKDYGVIIDYRGLLGNLDKALSDYSGLSGFDEEDIVNALFDIKEEIAKLKMFYTNLIELFGGVDKSMESYELFLGDKEKRELFYNYLSQFARALKLALSSDKFYEVFSQEKIDEYKGAMKFFSELRKSVRLRYFESIDFGKYEPQMQKLLDTYISANEVNNLTKLVDIFDKGFEKEIERVTNKDAKADMILNGCSAYISQNRDSNPAFYKKLSLKIEQILEEYRANRLSQEEKLQQAKELREILLNQNKQIDNSYPPILQNSKAKRAFFDNLSTLLEGELLIDTILKIDSIFKESSKKPEWKNSIDVRHDIEGKIDDIFWELEEREGLEIENIDEILEMIISIGINSY